MDSGTKGRGIKNDCRFTQNAAVNSALASSPRHTPARTLTLGGVGRDATRYSQGAGPSDSDFQNQAPEHPSRENESAVTTVTQMLTLDMSQGLPCTTVCSWVSHGELKF